MQFASTSQATGAKRTSVVVNGKKEVRDRLASTRQTQKITEAMRLVAASRVRKAQNAVLAGRPFSDNLIKVLYGVNMKLQGEDVESPLTQVRPVKRVLVVAIAGSRGLCGGYNNQVIKATVRRCEELKALGVPVMVMPVGRKIIGFFARRTDLYPMLGEGVSIMQTPTLKDAQGVADTLFAEFVGEEVDKVEIIYQRFVNLISSKPVVHTLLPLSRQGEICDVDGNCIDPDEDEIFRLTTAGTSAGGQPQLGVSVERVTTETGELDTQLLFEQEPAQILDALLPLYLNSVLLRALQEALASELAARMNAMQNASDNAASMAKDLNVKYNKLRQAQVTTELCEIIGSMVALEG